MSGVNVHLQSRFEKQCLDNGIIKPSEVKVFAKDTKGVYTNCTTFFMYRVWVNQEARVERLTKELKDSNEEIFMLGYTEAEYDFKKVKER